MATLDPVLPLQLRRDRGYVYFPDAIATCLKQFGLNSAHAVRAECYKTSDRQIRAVETKGEFIRTSELFGILVVNERRFVLHEETAANLARYDLSEPVFDFQLGASEMVVRGGEFPSLFHRWAVCCKKLYHQADPNPARRMLLQRIETFLPEDQAEEVFKLEFMTPERFMKFGVFQNGKRVGEVMAAAREMN